VNGGSLQPGGVYFCALGIPSNRRNPSQAILRRPKAFSIRRRPAGPMVSFTFFRGLSQKEIIRVSVLPEFCLMKQVTLMEWSVSVLHSNLKLNMN
jgi:hypothetical protein